jgi:uncharacterized membrane protein (DUF2068 family)
MMALHLAAVAVERDWDLMSVAAHPGYTRTNLQTAGAAIAAYAVLEGVEAIGLWLGRRWAGYLTFVSTVVLVPFEIRELTKSVTALKVLTLVINLAIVVYLLVSKRLFGLRGGGRSERAKYDAGVAGRLSSGPPPSRSRLLLPLTVPRHRAIPRHQAARWPRPAPPRRAAPPGRPPRRCRVPGRRAAARPANMR